MIDQIAADEEGSPFKERQVHYNEIKCVDNWGSPPKFKSTKINEGDAIKATPVEGNVKENQY